MLHVYGSSIEVPSFMHSLRQDEIDALTSSDTDGNIISCGVHPDGKLLFVTRDATVYEFNPEEYTIPTGDYMPVDRGAKVFLPNTNGRWPGDANGYYADASWLIDNSTPSMKSAQLHVSDNYICEIDVENPQKLNS